MIMYEIPCLSVRYFLISEKKRNVLSVLWRKSPLPLGNLIVELVSSIGRDQVVTFVARLLGKKMKAMREWHRQRNIVNQHPMLDLAIPHNQSHS